jgi:hypothetical protein
MDVAVWGCRALTAVGIGDESGCQELRGTTYSNTLSMLLKV